MARVDKYGEAQLAQIAKVKSCKNARRKARKAHNQKLREEGGKF